VLDLVEDLRTSALDLVDSLLEALAAGANAANVGVAAVGLGTPEEPGSALLTEGLQRVARVTQQAMLLAADRLSSSASTACKSRTRSSSRARVWRSCERSACSSWGVDKGYPRSR
jgi:hypothetical protein